MFKIKARKTIVVQATFRYLNVEFVERVFLACVAAALHEREKLLIFFLGEDGCDTC